MFHSEIWGQLTTIVEVVTCGIGLHLGLLSGAYHRVLPQKMSFSYIQILGWIMAILAAIHIAMTEFFEVPDPIFNGYSHWLLSSYAVLILGWLILKMPQKINMVLAVTLGVLIGGVIYITDALSPYICTVENQFGIHKPEELPFILVTGLAIWRGFIHYSDRIVKCGREKAFIMRGVLQSLVILLIARIFALFECTEYGCLFRLVSQAGLAACLIPLGLALHKVLEVKNTILEKLNVPTNGNTIDH